MYGRYARPCMNLSSDVYKIRRDLSHVFSSWFLSYFRASLDSSFLAHFSSDLFEGNTHGYLVILFLVIFAPQTPGFGLESLIFG